MEIVVISELVLIALYVQSPNKSFIILIDIDALQISPRGGGGVVLAPLCIKAAIKNWAFFMKPMSSPLGKIYLKG